MTIERRVSQDVNVQSATPKILRIDTDEATKAVVARLHTYEFARALFHGTWQSPYDDLETRKNIYEFSPGPLYRFDRNDGKSEGLAATTAWKPVLGRRVSRIFLNVFLYKEADPMRIVATRRGNVEVPNSQDGVVKANGLIYTLDRGGGVSTYTELAWLAELMRVATYINRPVVESLFDAHGDNIAELQETIRSGKYKGVDPRIVEADLALSLASRPAWEHLWGPSGIVGANRSKQVVIKPDAAMQGAYEASGMVIARDVRVGNDPALGRPVMRPRVMHWSPSRDQQGREEDIAFVARQLDVARPLLASSRA